MTSDQFVFWLQGFFEISQHSDGGNTLNEKQVEEIKNHLKLVMNKVTPDISEEKGTQLPLFPSYQPVMPPFNPGLEHDNTGVKPSWPHYPVVTCSSGANYNGKKFCHTGD